MSESKFEQGSKGPEQPERNILDQVAEAGDWLAEELRKLDTPKETIETRCHLFGQLVFLMLMHEKGKETPMELAQSYLEQFKPKDQKE